MPVASETERLCNMCVDATSFLNDAEKYLEPKVEMRSDLLAVSQKFYSFMKDFETFTKQSSSSLDELLVSGFDNEQIWQQIQLQNTSSLPKLKQSMKSLNLETLCLDEGKMMEREEKRRKKKKDRKRKAKEDLDDDVEEEVEMAAEDEDGVDDEEEDDENELEGIVQKSQKPKKYKSTVVDDEFFQLRQMEDCLDELDAVMDNKNKTGENKGLFEDESDGDDEERSTFRDFFDPPSASGKPRKKFEDDGGEKMEEMEDEVDGGDEEEEGEDFDDEDLDDDAIDVIGEENDENSGQVTEETEETDATEDPTTQSTFERRQKQMMKKIEKLEAENLSEKPWQMSGEALAKARPMNSLLEEYVSFDHTTVGAPTITEETTLSLEDLIKRRIKDQAWDDVLRKEKPVVQPFEYKKAPELNQEKSKISLAEVYEKEYLKEVEGEKEDKENEEHVEIQKLMDKLFVQLDALSNFHFTPKPPQPEVKVITNAPSLEMEEVLPITATEASQLAPEEIMEKKKGELVGDEERTEEDRKRDRRQKKIKKKFAAKAREKKEKAGKVPKSDHKQAIDTLKKGARNTMVDSKSGKADKPVKGSSDFFNKLQDEVKSSISKENSKGQKEAIKKRKSAESLKL